MDAWIKTRNLEGGSIEVAFTPDYADKVTQIECDAARQAAWDLEKCGNEPGASALVQAVMAVREGYRHRMSWETAYPWAISRRKRVTLTPEDQAILQELRVFTGSPASNESCFARAASQEYRDQVTAISRLKMLDEFGRLQPSQDIPDARVSETHLEPRPATAKGDLQL